MRKISWSEISENPDIINICYIYTVYKIILDFILDFPSFHNCFLRYEFESTIFEVLGRHI